MKLRIGIIGTRGIPNNYGGFEYFAEHLSTRLAQKEHEVFVYNSHNHSNQQTRWKGVHILHCYDPEHLLGTAGQFIYDLNCVRDAGKRKFDVLLFLGYTSSSVWGFLYPSSPIIISNMDGLEWKRTKYAAPVQKFLQYAEHLAIRYSDHFVADSTYIQSYLKEKYQVEPVYIAYGATPFNQPDETIPAIYQLKLYGYNMLMARMEPENNIETILDGYHASRAIQDFIVVGNTGNKFGKYLTGKYATDRRIRFVGAIFNQSHVNNLIYYSNLYFHGHSVGGTNPSLLEAMGSGALIVAQDNVFNKSVLETDGYYFETAGDIRHYAENLSKNDGNLSMRNNNRQKIENTYNWDRIVNAYELFFVNCYNEKQLKQSAPPLLHPSK
ncbi:DUF1972 domain-containing protein [Paraflavitalea sp. CAU 1676]|uniref:DUF1972 domain-containing protein n=1 Tax=Paraflavitalea sp. CAU 1676 TaxID=3032598 RepID=UPI0023DAA26A|nr:DUF1972 domain-containing protein [Paraflavitalea sp. CAU 1676]MDF2187450.1 DUF1972 domain-containing protein [Paraflavitalea sp. CAU 1676]